MIAAVVIVVVLLAVITAGASVRVVRQYERGVVLRFGRVREPVRRPGLALIRPVADRLHKVSVQIVTMTVPAQEGITRDNVTVRVDAVVYFRVSDPVRAIVEVQDYRYAVSQVAQTSLRSVIGKSDLDDLLSNREALNQGLELMIDSPAVGWGVEIDRVEIKDVALPESMKRSMSRQAEAERERRSRVITADGEFQASRKLASAAQVMSTSPSALQLRLLQTIVEVAAEKNSTVVLPFPVELLRFLEGATAGTAAGSATAAGAHRSAGTDATPTRPGSTNQTGSPHRVGTPSIAPEGAAATATAASGSDPVRRTWSERLAAALPPTPPIPAVPIPPVAPGGEDEPTAPSAPAPASGRPPAGSAPTDTGS